MSNSVINTGHKLPNNPSSNNTEQIKQDLESAINRNNNNEIIKDKSNNIKDMITNERENNNYLILTDNSSEINKTMHKNLIEPTIVISIILGYDNLDDYAIELIRR